MLSRVIHHFIDTFFGRLPAIAQLGPITALPNTKTDLKIRDLLDGIVFATPKRRHNIFMRWRRKYGEDNWKYGLKLWKPKRNIVSCAECGSFHEIHTICRSCYKKVEEESKHIINKIRTAWGSSAVDRDVQVLYQGETPSSVGKRIVELDKPRPMWFAPNLSQKTAQPGAQISEPPTEAVDKTIKFKDDARENAQ